MPFVGLDPQLATELATEMRTAAAGADEQSAVAQQALALAELSSSVPVSLLEISEDLTIASDVVTASADLVASYELDPGTEAAIARGLWMLALGQVAGQLGEEDLTDVDAALANFSLLYRLPQPTSITGVLLGIPTTDPAIAAAVARLNTWLLPVLTADRGGAPELGEQEEADLHLLLELLGFDEEEAMVREEHGDDVDIFFSVGAAIGLLRDRAEADRRFFEYGVLPDVEDIVGEGYDPDDTTELDWLPAALAGRAEAPAGTIAVLQLLRLAARHGYKLNGRYGPTLSAGDLRDESPDVLAHLAGQALAHLRGEDLLSGAVREGTELQIFSSTAIAAQIRFGAARGAVSDAAIANAAQRADTAFGIPPGAVVSAEVMQGPPVLMDRAAFNQAVATEVGRIPGYPTPLANQLTASYNWIHQAGSLAEQRQRMLDVLLSWRTHALVGTASMTVSEQRRALAEFHPDLPKELREQMDPDRLNKVVEHLGVGGYHKIKLSDRYILHLSNDDLGRVAGVQMEHRQTAGWGYVMTALGVAGAFFPPAAVMAGAMQAMQAAANDDWAGAGIAALGAFAGAASVASAASAASAAAATTAGAASAAAASAANAATVSQIAYAAQGAAIATRAIDDGDTVGAITAGAGALAGGLGASGFQNTSRLVGAGGAAVGVAQAIDDGDLLLAAQHTASAIGQFGSILGLDGPDPATGQPGSGVGSVVMETLGRVEQFAQVARGIRDEDPVLIANALRQEIVGLATAATDFVTRTVGNLTEFATAEPQTMARIDELSDLPPGQLAREKDALEAELNPRRERLGEVLERLETPPRFRRTPRPHPRTRLPPPRPRRTLHRNERSRDRTPAPGPPLPHHPRLPTGRPVRRRHSSCPSTSASAHARGDPAAVPAASGPGWHGGFDTFSAQYLF
jgi:hypothetical protein